MKRLNVLLPEPVHRSLKLAAFSSQETVTTVITRLVMDYLLAAGAVAALLSPVDCLPEAFRAEEVLERHPFQQLSLLEDPGQGSGNPPE